MTQRLDYPKVIPDAIEAFGRVRQYVAKSGLPAELIDLVYLRVSQINGCAYCIDLHTRDLLKGDVTIQKIALVPIYWEAKSFFSAKERAALAWAESLRLSRRLALLMRTMKPLRLSSTRKSSPTSPSRSA